MSDSMRSNSLDNLRYLRQVSLRETEVQKRLRDETDQLPESGWEVAPEQAQFLALLVEITGATRVLEVGTFTGHSSLAMAMALPADGELITCDMVRDYTNIAEKYWREAGVDDKIELRIAPAKDSLDALIETKGAGYFDMAFIDANKKDYGGYFERAMVLVRPGGLIALDNMLWSGRVIDQSNAEKSTVAIRALNEKLRDDDRVSVSMLPLDDGLTLAWKRP